MDHFPVQQLIFSFIGYICYNHTYQAELFWAREPINGDGDVAVAASTIVFVTLVCLLSMSTMMSVPS